MRTKNKLLIIIGVIIIFLISTSVVANHECMEVAGSTSVQPLAEELVSKYNEDHDSKINVQGGGSGMGLRSVSQGIADIGMISKEVSPEESKNLQIVKLGKEGIVIAVHNENNINELSIDEIKKIFSGEINNWKDLGGYNKEIHVMTREEGSGTRDAFESVVMDDSKIINHAIVQTSTESIKQSVATDPGAIGYISFAHMSDDVKAVDVDGVSPTEETIMDDTYRLQRPFIFLISDNPSDEVIEFINWIKSPEGKKIILKEKIVPYN